MSNKMITSALDITNWFCKRADSEGFLLEEEKIQHLLFLSQIHFMLKSGHCLIPSFFVCGHSGFYEANIRTLMPFGLPLMVPPNFSADINEFLELIWQKYGHQDESELNRFIISLECWKQSYRPERDVIIDISRITDSFASSIKNKNNQDLSLPHSKVMLSQHGPVRVSTWHPRKLDSKK